MSLMKFLESTRKPTVIYTDNSSEFGKSCEDLSWNHCTSTPTQIRHKCDCWESSAQSERRHLCRTVAVRSGQRMVGGFRGVLLLSAKYSGSFIWWEITIWKAVRNALLTDQWYRLEQWSNVTLFLRRTYLENINSVQKVLPGFFFGYVLYAARLWKGDIMIEDIEELEEMDASELHTRKLNAKDVLKPQRNGDFIFPVTDGTVVSWGDQRLRTSTLIRDRLERGEEQEVFRGESDGLSTPTPLQDDSTRDDAEFCKKKKLLVFYGRFRLSSSRWTQRQIVHVKRRNISSSNEAHRRYQNHTYVTGRIVVRTDWGLLERGWSKRIVRCMDRIHKIHFIERKATLTDTHGPEREEMDTFNANEKWQFIFPVADGTGRTP